MFSNRHPQSRTTRDFLRHTLVYLKPYKFLAAANILLAILTIAFYFTFPLITQYIIDNVITGKNIALLLPAILGLLGAFLLCALFNSLRIVVNTRFGQNVIYDMRRDIYDRIQGLPVNFFDQQTSGDLMTRVIDDLSLIHI